MVTCQEDQFTSPHVDMSDGDFESWVAFGTERAFEERDEAYLAVTGLLFGLLALLHVVRIVVEWDYFVRQTCAV